MAKLTPEMQELFKSTKYFPLATASKDGEPNVVPVGSVFLMDPETIWIGNQFMDTTLKNVIDNPRASLYVWTQGVKGCLKIKGDVTVMTEGEDYARMKGFVSARKAELKCRSLLILNITEVYECSSGADAGKRLI
ncbi:MAG: pyridoxamine 5'-phosphate oxidase family protein [Methanomassiliicoccus sp.]|nr:pyridoxamine 5'-phosphate oxidase family protein [Methanomassiliicoccus sp.]